MESLEFYKHIPAKTCAQCGKTMEEQYESHETVCDTCKEVETK